MSFYSFPYQRKAKRTESCAADKLINSFVGGGGGGGGWGEGVIAEDTGKYKFKGQQFLVIAYNK